MGPHGLAPVLERRRDGVIEIGSRLEDGDRGADGDGVEPSDAGSRARSPATVELHAVPIPIAGRFHTSVGSGPASSGECDREGELHVVLIGTWEVNMSVVQTAVNQLVEQRPPLG